MTLSSGHKQARGPRAWQSAPGRNGNGKTRGFADLIGLQPLADGQGARHMYTRRVTTFFISDLHLNGAQPEITRQFMEFLRGPARAADHLYILGDLFEFWIGDDDPDPSYAQVQDELRALTAAGVPCSVMHGNRDFLLGKDFCARTGCALIEDGTIIRLYGQEVLLMHGDLLCTDDHSYQRLRRFVRNPVIQWLFKHLPLKRRERIANRIRAGSRKHTRTTMSQIMDVNQQTVKKHMAALGICTLIHGHTHRPDIHHFELGSVDATRIVLGDWHTQGSVLRWSAQGYELLTLPR